MKKIYVMPQIEEVTFKIEQYLCAGSDIDFGDPLDNPTSDSKDDDDFDIDGWDL